MFEAIAAFLAEGAGAAAGGGAAEAAGATEGAGAIAGNTVAGNAGAGASGGILDKASNLISNAKETFSDPKKLAQVMSKNGNKKRSAPVGVQQVPIENMQIPTAPDAGALLSQLASMNNQ